MTVETPLSISGTVIHGNRLGAMLGFPTANLEPDPYTRHLPSSGVYAVIVDLDGLQIKGMANVGTRPTIGGTSRSIEAHLFDFNGDLYGKTITVRFVKRIRDEQKFGSLEELKTQLQKDRITASELLSRPF